MTVGNTIKFLRMEFGFSHIKLSEISGISVKNIIEYEKGTYRPSEKNIIKLSMAFNVSTICFMDERTFQESKTDILEKLPVGKRIEVLRVINGISLEKLSEVTGVEKRKIIHYESGREIPSIEDLKKFSAVLETGFDILADINYESDELNALESKQLNKYYNSMNSRHKQMLVEIAKTFAQADKI